MALTAQTIFDIDAGTQSITFSNPAAIDTISYSSNTLTFGTTSDFTLSKSDFALYNKYLQAFNSLLIFNFPKIASFFNGAFPPSLFAIYSPDLTYFEYIQSSNNNVVYQTIYTPPDSSTAIDFPARIAVTISLQEFELGVALFSQFANQVALN